MSDEMLARYRAAKAEQDRGEEGPAKAAFLRALLDNAFEEFNR